MGFAIAWSEEYATGIEIIDEQHKRIFLYLAEIDEAINNHSADKVEEVVRGLLDYSVTHNTFEESLMEKADYPMLEPHRQAHEAFKRRAENFVKRLTGGEDRIRLAREVRTEIGLWLTGHIKREDQHYVPYVKKGTDKGFIGRMLTKFFG